jgi:hypothetical protein
MSETLPVAWAVDSPRARYALDVLLGLLGLRARDALPGESAVISYGGSDAAIQIAAGSQEDWDDPDPQPSGVAGLPEDLLYATYACLTAPWEQVDPRNEVGTPIAADGWLHRHGLLDEPHVHRYAAALAKRLQRGRLPQPALVLTHDVDEHFGHLFGRRESLTRLRREFPHASSVRRAAGLARRLLRRGRDPNDRWDEWRELVRDWSGQATFFAASYNLFDAGAARFDVAYDVRRPEVARELRGLAEAGADIGIHFSLQARNSAEQVRRERERLEEALGMPICSSRHHWWALGERPWRTLRMHAQAEMTIDCSFGFNDLPGFRRGIAAPFRPFDPERQEVLPILCLPTTAMDRCANDPAALARLLEISIATGGALVLDWHAHVLNPAALPGARDALFHLVGLAQEHSVQLRTPLELAASAYDRDT